MYMLGHQLQTVYGNLFRKLTFCVPYNFIVSGNYGTCTVRCYKIVHTSAWHKIEYRKGRGSLETEVTFFDPFFDRNYFVIP